MDTTPGELLTLGLLVLARGSPADTGLVLVQVEVAHQALGPPTQLHHLGPGLHAAHAFLHCDEKGKQGTERAMERESAGDTRTHTHTGSSYCGRDGQNVFT